MPSSFSFSIGNTFTNLLEIDSTNNYAMQQIKNGTARHGQVWRTEYQTAGKGRRNKTWNATKGENILLSAALNVENLFLLYPFLLSAAMACGVYSFVNCVWENNNWKIKWPNDIYWHDKKAAGLLIENVYNAHQWRWSVVGIGININQTSFEGEQKAISLKQISGKSYNVQLLAEQLCKHLEQAFQILQQAPETILQNYNEKLYCRYQTVKFKKQNAVFEGKVIEVNKQGELMIERAPHTVFNYVADEIQWLIF